MGLVRGENVVVLIYDNGGWRLYGCARSCSLSVDSEMLETSTTGSGNFATFTYGKHSFTGSIDGLVNLNSDSMLGLADLRQRQLSKQVLLMRYQRTDNTGNVYTDECNFLISNSSDTGSYSDMDTFSIALQGTGAIKQVFTPTNFALSAVRTFLYTATGGESSFAFLAGKDVLNVSVDGKNYDDIITTGSPVDTQALYVSGTGVITIAQALEAGVYVKVMYQDIP